MAHSLLSELRKMMRKAGDPERARGQQAYMKSSMPYHGLRNAETRAICREVFHGYEPNDWQADVAAIWRAAKWREERYAAIELAQIKKARPLHTIEALPLFEELVVSGAWWDYVDSIAAHDVGLILEQDPRPARKAMLAWSKSDDIWKRRTSILAQLRFKDATDMDLLYRCIEPSLGEKEFFLRKAIGWALRELAYVDPAEVIHYVRANERRLSPLSRREALKHLSK
jgi:3-methyladenine DNA glycosylase AlkD